MLPLLPAGPTSAEDVSGHSLNWAQSLRSSSVSPPVVSSGVHFAGSNAPEPPVEDSPDNKQHRALSLQTPREKLHSGIATALPSSLTRLACRVLGECLDVFSGCGVWAKVAVASEAVFFSRCGH